MSNLSTMPAGRWEPMARKRAVAAAADAIWHNAPGRVSLIHGNAVLAWARTNGCAGADQRWLLRLSGWQWHICHDPLDYHHAKRFLTRIGAKIEAEDIIAGAAEWRG